ncbi:MAG: GNAT family N-acetyltransferase [Desulforhopalus sp.]|nr:GNAT family N-acetyltransferase [Desulforhopalus sp.]
MIQLVELEKKYLLPLVHVHTKSFPDFFLTFLGDRFLKEFYAYGIGKSEVPSFVAIDNKYCVVGGIIGPLHPEGYFSKLLADRWWAFILASFSAIIRKPVILPRLMRAFFYRGKSAVPVPKNYALLSSIAVDPNVQAQGVGRMLVQRWMAAVKDSGSSGCYLTTDAMGNDGVNVFYQKMGWSMTGSFSTPEGRLMNLYTYDFR